jgi:RHS repeat-associated protein
MNNTLCKVFLVLGLAAGTFAVNAWAGSLITYDYDKFGNRTAVTTQASDGRILEKTTYTYDDYRRCTSKTEAAHTLPDPPPPERTWTWNYERYFADDPNHRYDPSAHTSKQWRLQYEPAYDSAGTRHVTVHWFDANDRIVDEYTGMIDIPGPGGGLRSGPDTEVHHFGYDENGQKNRYTDPQTRVTDYVYDVRNRLRDTIEPKRDDQATRPTTTTLYDFAGNKTSVTFPDGRTQKWRDYDAFGQARTFFDERDDRTDLGYCWGPMKKLCTVTTHRDKDGGGNEDQLTVFWSDQIGRPVRTTFPDGSTEESSYLHGQLTIWKNRKEQTKTITYDARDREVSHHWTGAFVVAPEVLRSWDDANRIVTLCNSYSTIDYQYDGAGLVWQEGNFIAGSGERKATTYTRYPNSSVSDVQYPDGLSIHRNYTSRGQLKSVSDGRTAAPVVDYTYLPDGKVDHSILANGTRTDYGYDPRGLNSSIRTYMSSGQELWKRTYSRDDRDRIVALQRGSNNGANLMENGRGDHFWYDFEGQLIDGYYGALDPVNNPHGQLRQDHFEYDPLGNRRRNPSNGLDNLLASRGWMQFTREDNKLNQYHAWGVNQAIYDEDAGGWGSPQHANGVLMQEGHVTAGYNSLNQMVMVAGTPGWIFFGYDPLGRRVKQWTGGLTGANLVPEPGDSTATYFYYDGWNLIQEGPSAAVASRNYVHGARVDEIVKQITPPNQWERYFHYDARGHCSLQTDAGGNIVEQYDYDAFGQPYFYDWAGNALVQYNSATGQWEGYSPWGNRFLFTGREWMSDNGTSPPHNLKLYDYRNRIYQPELGRFMQPDPQHFEAGDYNLYRYCHNDPVNNSDPTGLSLTGSGGGDWDFDNGRVAMEQIAQQQQAAGNSSNQVRLEFVRHPTTTESVDENRLKSTGQLASGETVPSFEVNEYPKESTVRGELKVNVKYADGPKSKAGPKTMAHTKRMEPEHEPFFDKFARQAQATVNAANSRLHFRSLAEAKRFMEGSLRTKYNETYVESRKLDNPYTARNMRHDSNSHNSPYEYEE